ncbi:hypothetical protein GCM10027413_31120 [Conyzicola nivalis]|jgi:hypothetical protein|uniref:Zinc ribbon domain-containing protein n=1 Tax=Conyzicola nivalis TaxID=1477021 RepID=A0A916ST26_9MICO|nr:zinc-ribbon domain-containing protein [Conyzicola nivalis]GGB12391.1 hypothetical protein GCM10010979_28400 [Conyzicola nivalis]
MARCISCSAELQPAWKFCIYCGQKVEAVPAAIRPDVTEDAPRGHVTALALFGWGLGGLLAAITVVAVVVLNL